MERMTNFMRVKKRPVQLKDDTKADHKQQKTVHQSPVAHTVSGKRTVDVKSAIHERSSPDEEDPTEYVPEFIYKTVKYKHKNAERKIPHEEQTVVEYIKTHFIVPDDFERNHKQYGPLSGLTYEHRLTRAYTLHMLERKHPKKAEPAVICLTCAKIGHSYKECEDGF